MRSDSASSAGNPPHFLLVPLFAQGHMIPMLDLARLLAARGILVTFVTTPVNLNRIRPTVDRAAASGLPIRFVELNFPAVEAGLPEGCENIDLVRSMDLFLPFMNALALLREPLVAYLQDAGSAPWPQPACIISDNLHHWTAGIARSLDIPRLIFHGPSCFYLFSSLVIQRHKAELEAAMEAASGAPIPLPGLPHRILISKNQLATERYTGGKDWSKFQETVREAEESADGVLANSFAELEPWYLESYREAINKPVWPIGPVSLYGEDLDAKAVRGRVSAVDNSLLVQWLDEQKPGSAVFVSFGSIAHNSAAQLMELGHGLEASGRPFVWAVKEVAEGRQAPLLDGWLQDLEGRLDGRGVVIRGWAPQAVILAHAAVGGFVTHCGWNSILESVAQGVVMATWPHFADQFLNEKLVVEVLRIGVEVGVDEPTVLEEDGVVKVRRGDVESVLERLMGDEEEAQQRRARARELGDKAKRAMDQGGSSWLGLNDVIRYVSEYGKQDK